MPFDTPFEAVILILSAILVVCGPAAILKGVDWMADKYGPPAQSRN